MTVTKHAYARFKQRQNLKNIGEMSRRCSLAITRGILVPMGGPYAKAACYEYGGFRYIVSVDNKIVITTFPAKKQCRSRKNWLQREERFESLCAEMD